MIGWLPFGWTIVVTRRMTPQTPEGEERERRGRREILPVLFRRNALSPHADTLSTGQLGLTMAGNVGSTKQ